jgi:type I restriction enzyme S subunit
MNRGVPVKFLYRVVDERGGEGSSLPLMSVSLTRGVVPRSDISESEGRADDLSNYKVCRPGDIVINRMSAYQGALGLSHDEGLVSPDYLVLRPNKDVSPLYLTYMFKSRWFVGEMTRRLRGIGSTEQANVRTPRINSDDLGLISINLPTLAGQKTIAGHLERETSRIDTLIEKKQHQIKLIEERFNADGLNIISGAARDFENSSDKSVSVNRSSEWLPLKLAWCLKTGSGTTPTSGTANYYSEDGIPWVTTAELREDVILKTSMGVTDEARRNFSALKVFPIGTVLVAMYGATVGRAAVLGIEACVNQACCAIYGQGRINIDYFYWWARLHRQDLIDLGYGSGQPNISQDTIRSLRIYTPSVEQQEAIVHYLVSSWTRTEALLNMTKQHIQLLVERKQSMITAAVTGELEIPEVAA